MKNTASVFLGGLLSANLLLVPPPTCAAQVNSIDATGMAGSTISPVLTLDFEDQSDMLTLDFSLSYSAEALAFSEGSTSVGFNGANYTLAEFVSALGDYGNVVTASWSGTYLLSFFSYISAAPITAPLVLNTTFDILPTATAGNYAVSITGNSADSGFSEYYFAGDANVLVTSVPEPELFWLMLSGLICVAAIGRRNRQSFQSKNINLRTESKY